LSKGPEIISKFANIINDNFPTILKKGVELVWNIIKGLIQAIPDLIQNIPKIITAIVDVWEAFNWVNLGKNAIKFLKDGITSMVGAIKTAGKNVSDAAVNALKNLPTQLSNFGKNAMTGLGNALKGAVGSLKNAATSIFNAIVNVIKTLPEKMLSIGSDLVKGLWNGISNMVGWITGKIQSFGESVMSGIKSFFGIESPSKLMRDEVGTMLSAGVAEGITAGEKLPLKAISDLSRDVMAEAANMDGLTLERNLQHTFTAPEAPTAGDAGMLSKLDAILEAIKAGQLITLDGRRLVGGTVNQYDNALGQRRELVARGAI
jgi:phage-related protein